VLWLTRLATICRVWPAGVTVRAAWEGAREGLGALPGGAVAAGRCPGPSGLPIRLIPLWAETRAKDLGLVCWRGVLGGCCLAAGPAGVFQRQGDEGRGDG
jgi:hypothetical protein